MFKLKVFILLYLNISFSSTGHLDVITADQQLKHSIVIRPIGLKNLKAALINLFFTNNFILKERSKASNKLLFNSEPKPIIKFLNYFSNCGTAYIGRENYYDKLAQYFHSDTSNFLLKEVEICRYFLPFIDSDKCIFRLGIYYVDSLTGAPMNPLIDSAIEVVSRERRSIINLEKYKIYIKERDFFVSVEWLKMPFNSKLRNIKQGKKISYNPLIAFKSRKKNESFNNRNVWIKNFTGKWEPVLYASKLMISATIKY